MILTTNQQITQTWLDCSQLTNQTLDDFCLYMQLLTTICKEIRNSLFYSLSIASSFVFVLKAKLSYTASYSLLPYPVQMKNRESNQ